VNCKPGDLAVFVRPRLQREAAFLGRIVRIVGKRPVKHPLAPHVLGWRIEPALGERQHCADDALRPIRDPGDDAKDEMLRPLPVTKPVKEAA
jgi:hypothetical protein